MRVTRRGFAVLAVAVPLLAAGWWGRYPLAGVLGAILLGLLLAAVVSTGRRLRIAVDQSVYPARVVRGQPALARLRVRNPGSSRQPSFTATDTAGPVTRTVQVQSLLPGAETTQHYDLPTDVRGRWTVGPLTLVRRDAFGLAGSSLTAGGSTTLWVHPRQHPARALYGGQRRHHHEGAVTDSALRGSVELNDVREYVPGDEVRLLHWKATARTGRLMVRDLADPQRSRFTVLLDTRAAAATPERFEELVEAAASLLCASARAGQQHTCLLTSSGGRIAADGAPGSTGPLLDGLSEVRQDDAEVTLPADRGGGLVVVCGAGPVLVPAAWLRQRFTQVYAIVLSGSAEVPGARTLRAESASEAVRRWNETLG